MTEQEKRKNEFLFMIEKYWYMLVIYAVILIGTAVLIYLLRNRPDISYKIGYFIAAYLLVLKTLQYVSKALAGFQYPYPIEMSAVSYFVYGIIITFRIKKLQDVGIFFGFTSGFFYILSVLVSPGSHVALFEQTLLMGGSDYALYHSWDQVCTLFNHTSMFVGSALLLCNVRKFNWKKHWKPTLAVILEIIYVWAIYIYAGYGENYGKPVFCQITDGSIINTYFPQIATSSMLPVIWLSIVTPVFFGYLALFYLLNIKMAKLREKNGILPDYYPQKVESTYRISVKNK